MKTGIYRASASLNGSASEREGFLSNFLLAVWCSKKFLMTPKHMPSKDVQEARVLVVSS
jgi:hypothetical protein